MLWLINLADLFENVSTFVCFIMPFIVHVLINVFIILNPTGF